MYWKLRPTATAATFAVVFAYVVGWRSCSSYYTAVLAPYVRVILVPQRMTMSKIRKVTRNDMENGHREARAQPNSSLRSTALVHACSRGCLGVSGRAKASAKGRRDGSTACFCLEILSRKNIMFWEFLVTKRLAVGNLCHEVVVCRR